MELLHNPLFWYVAIFLIVIIALFITLSMEMRGKIDTGKIIVKFLQKCGLNI